MNTENTSKTIYIAGPMTGLPDNNWVAFRRAEANLKAQFPNCKIINPIDNFGGRTDQPWHYYMGLSIGQLLSEATRIYLLDNWWDSKGAKIEAIVAGALGLEITLGYGEATDELMEVAEDLERIEKEAKSLVLGDRNDAYGSPVDDFIRTMQIKLAMECYDVPKAFKKHWIKHGVFDMESLIEAINSVGLSDALEFARTMIACKLSRQCHKPKHDNLVDLAGYVLCYKWVKTGNRPE